MGEKQSRNGNYRINDRVFYVVLFFLIIIVFALLTPKVVSRLFPFKRQMVLNDFLLEVQKKHTISAQDFWKFREFYSPGSYIFERRGIPSGQLVQGEYNLGIVPVTSKVDRIFLIFSSPHLKSMEALVTTPYLSNVVDLTSLDKKTIIFSAINELIYKDSDGKMHIFFVKPESQMQSANGFFDYTGEDKHLVAGKYWFDSTVVYEK